MPPNYKKRKPMISGQEITEPPTFTSHMNTPKKISPDDKSLADATPKEIAEYSAEILAELRDLANASGHKFLAYLIQVAVEEAKIQASGDEQY
jgi:hypothetical protein